MAAVKGCSKFKGHRGDTTAGELLLQGVGMLDAWTGLCLSSTPPFPSPTS